MKKWILFLIAALFPVISFAEDVTKDEAMSIAQRFMTQKRKSADSRRLTADRASESLELVSPLNSDTIPAYYIFNKVDGKGFIIVSGETEATQILAYSDECSFDMEKISQEPKCFWRNTLKILACSRQKR